MTNTGGNAQAAAQATARALANTGNQCCGNAAQARADGQEVQLAK
jgi:hypothetical protein